MNQYSWSNLSEAYATRMMSDMQQLSGRRSHYASSDTLMVY